MTAEQAGLFVERIAVIADEHRRNAKGLAVRVLHDEHRARRIPGRIAARFESRAHAARGKARGVRLALNQLRARKFFDHASVVVEGQKGVVLLGRRAGLRLEPVAEMSHALGERPFFDRVSDGVGDILIELFAGLDRREKLRVNFFRKLFFHLPDIEGIDSVELGDSKIWPFSSFGGSNLRGMRVLTSFECLKTSFRPSPHAHRSLPPQSL